MIHEDIAQVHGMFKKYPDLGPFVWIAPDGRSHDLVEEPAIINRKLYSTIHSESILRVVNTRIVGYIVFGIYHVLPLELSESISELSFNTKDEIHRLC